MSKKKYKKFAHFDLSLDILNKLIEVEQKSTEIYVRNKYARKS